MIDYAKVQAKIVKKTAAEPKVGNVTWVRQHVMRKGKRKPIEADVGSLHEQKDRFILYGSKMIPTMWSLHDFVTGTTHFLYGEGWEGARGAAETTIYRVLHPKRVASKTKTSKVKRKPV